MTSRVHFVYLLRCADNTLYTGYATDLQKRVDEHNGQSNIAGAKYTYPRRPVQLVYSESFSTRSEAMSREYAIKKMTKNQKELLIADV